MKHQYNLLGVVFTISILFISNLRAQDNRESDCIRFEPTNGIWLPPAKVGASSEGTFEVHNKNSAPITFEGLYPRNSYNEYFTVVSPSLPAVIDGNSSLTVTIRFTPSEPFKRTTFFDGTTGASELFYCQFGGSGIDTNICHYLLYGVGADTAGVQSGVVSETAAQALDVYPNPATEQVKVSMTGGYLRHVEIFDDLGTSIATAQNTTSWSWDLRSTSGAKAPAGVYFVRAVVIGSNGEYVTTKKVVVK
jgi:hypothetical protein